MPTPPGQQVMSFARNTARAAQWFLALYRIHDPKCRQSAGLEAAGRPDLHLQWAVLSVFLYLPAFYIGLNWGIVGVATGYLAATIVLVPMHFAFVRRVMNIRMTEVFATVYPAVVGTTIMTLAVRGRCATPLSVPSLLVLVALIVLGALTYVATVWLVAPGAIGRLCTSSVAGY